jgi:autotransporter-associated beta strand protein
MIPSGLGKTLLILACLAAASPASAGTTTTWSGTAANNNWSTNGNWTTKPTTSGTFSLVYRGTPTRTTSTNDIGSVKIDSILFANTGATGSTSTFILSKTSTTPALSLLNGATVTTTAATSGTLSDTISSAIAFSGTGTFNIGSLHNLSVTGTLSGGGSLVKTGAGELLLSGANDLAALQIDQGVVQANTTAFGGITGLTVDIGSTDQTGTFRTAGVGSALSPVLTNMQFKLNGHANITPNSSSNITFNAANFNTAVAGVTTPVTLGLIGGNAVSNGIQTIDGVIQNNSDSGTVGVMIGGQNFWVLNGTNTYSGGTTLNSGMLVVGNANALGTGDLAVNAGTLDLNGRSVAVATLSGSSGGIITSSSTGAVTLTGSSASDSTYAGEIQTGSGTIAFVKQGAGTLTLSGSSSYTGATTVSAGTLLVNGSLTNSAVTVGNGGTLGGSGTIGSLVTVQSGGVLSPGNSPGALAAAALDLQAGSTTFMQVVGFGSAAGVAGTDYDQVQITTASSLAYGGNLVLSFISSPLFDNGTMFSLFSFTGTAGGGFNSVTTAAGSSSYSGMTFQHNANGNWYTPDTSRGQYLVFDPASGRLSIIPEPSTWVLAVIGAGFLGLKAQQRRRRAKLVALSV